MDVPLGAEQFTFLQTGHLQPSSMTDRQRPPAQVAPRVTVNGGPVECVEAPALASSSRARERIHELLEHTAPGRAQVEAILQAIDGNYGGEHRAPTRSGESWQSEPHSSPVYRISTLSEPPSPSQLLQSSNAPGNVSLLNLLVVEVLANDFEYDSDISVTFPWQCEDLQTENGKAELDDAQHSDDTYDWSDSDSSTPSLVGNMEQLLLRHQEQEFEEAQRRNYLRKKKKWRKGGNHKRSHAESVGSDSDDNLDVVPLDDADIIGSSARRLRRRTDTLNVRPNRSSLLFDDPPREVEELSEDNIEAGVVIDSDDDTMLPLWLYPGMMGDSGSDDDDDDDDNEDDDESDDDADTIPVVHLPPLRSYRK